MVTTVTLNPCVDLTVELDDLRLGQYNLVQHSRSDVAGKGINVSVVLKNLGVETRCAGISYDGDGQRQANYLAGLGIPHRFAVAHGDLRTNIKVLDRKKNEMTELNSKGEPISAAVFGECLRQLEAFAQDSDIMVFSGRVPNGMADDTYLRCLRAVADCPVKTIVDAVGKPLRLALEAKPYLIKPNVFELEHTFGFKIRTRQDALEACREVIAMGAQVVCVSIGKEGAIIADKDEAWAAPALDLEILGFQGAGDSMVGGICRAICHGGGLAEMLADGVAAASASLIREGTLLCLEEDFQRMRALVHPVRMEEDTE